MCDYAIIKVDRFIKKGASKIILVSREFFNKLSTTTFIKVLAYGNREKTGLSKSYYYYILDELRKKGLVEDNAIVFKAVIPLIITQGGLLFDNSILYLDEKNRTLILMDMGSNKYSCPNCPVYVECVYGLKRIVSDVNISIKVLDEENARDLRIPSKLWTKVVFTLLQKNLRNFNSLIV